MGFHAPANKAAAKGDIVHKTLEILANKKLAIQNKEEIIKDYEIRKDFFLDEATHDNIIPHVYEYYSLKNPEYDWDDKKDYNDCFNLVETVLDSEYSPLKHDIIAAEQFFDFTIDKDWAKYEYKMGEKKIDGQLGIRGSLDLVIKHDKDTVFLLDWKTGRRYNWASNKEKDFNSLMNDPQMLMYFYALNRLYPDAKSFVVVIYWIKENYPILLPFSKKDLIKTERKLASRFEQIRNCRLPRRIIDDEKNKWKCFKLCYYGKNKQPGTNKTICDYYHEKLVTLGMDRIMKHGKTDGYDTYGAGGGSSDKTNTEKN